MDPRLAFFSINVRTSAYGPAIRGVESSAVLVRRDSDQPNKRAAHYISASKPAVEGDLFEAPVGSFELALRFFDPHLQNVFGGCPSQFPREYTLKITDTHGEAICQHLH